MRRVNLNDPNPRYVQAKAILLETIQTGALEPGQRLPGERELAEQLGVSQMTANRAIQELVKEGYLRREVGVGTFVVSREPQARRERDRVHVVLFSEIGLDMMERDVYLGLMLRGMTDQGSRCQCDFIFVEAFQPGSLVKYATRTNASVDRLVLVIPPNDRLNEIIWVADVGIPHVVVGAHWPDLPQIRCVDCDNHEAAQLVVRHLHQLGHCNIAFLYMWSEAQNTLDRLEGYRSACKKLAIPLRPEWTRCVPVPEQADEIDAIMAELLASGGAERPTAVVAAGYQLALQSMRSLQARGLRIPDDISLVGFDDSASAAFLQPPLTTVRQPLLDMGLVAIREVIAGGKPRVQLLNAELVIRRSTGMKAGTIPQNT